MFGQQVVVFGKQVDAFGKQLCVPKGPSCLQQKALGILGVLEQKKICGRNSEYILLGSSKMHSARDKCAQQHLALWHLARSTMGPGEWAKKT